VVCHRSPSASNPIRSFSIKIAFVVSQPCETTSFGLISAHVRSCGAQGSRGHRHPAGAGSVISAHNTNERQGRAWSRAGLLWCSHSIGVTSVHTFSSLRWTPPNIGTILVHSQVALRTVGAPVVPQAMNCGCLILLMVCQKQRKSTFGSHTHYIRPSIQLHGPALSTSVSG
jgi:hypothetical protein